MEKTSAEKDRIIEKNVCALQSKDRVVRQK